MVTILLVGILVMCSRTETGSGGDEMHTVLRYENLLGFLNLLNLPVFVW